jgi:hypothetical protein
MKMNLMVLLLALTTSNAFADQCYKVESITSEDKVGTTVKLEGVSDPILILSDFGTAPDAKNLAQVAFISNSKLCTNLIKNRDGITLFGTVQVRR